MYNYFNFKPCYSIRSLYIVFYLKETKYDPGIKTYLDFRFLILHFQGFQS